MQVQNKLAQAEAGLPAEVTRQGITVEKSATGFLMVVALVSSDGTRTATDLSLPGPSPTLEAAARARGVPVPANAALPTAQICA